MNVSRRSSFLLLTHSTFLSDNKANGQNFAHWVEQMRLLWVCCAFTSALKTALKIHREVVSGSSTQIVKICLIENASIGLQ